MEMYSHLNFNCVVNMPKLSLPMNSLTYEQRNIGDGTSINVNKCLKTKCTEFCRRFLPACRVFGTSTGRYLDCKNEDFPREISCNSVNVVYVITCSTCYLQYVGQTATAIGLRFGTHRAVMRGATYSNSCKRLY